MSPPTRVGLPKDTDGDGIPDYVENWHGDGDYSHTPTPKPTGRIHITRRRYCVAYSTVYDDVDLSGNGLVGRIKKALGLSPFDTVNPFTLNQITTGLEPDIATFDLPISYDVLTNIGGLTLNMNGIDVTFEGCYRATNGDTLLAWNTTYDPPGPHCLQPQLTLVCSAPDTAILSGLGRPALFYSSNVLQFFESDAAYDDSGAYLDAQLPVPNATYSIRLYDPSTTPPTLLRTITNYTSSGMIQEDWDLTCDTSTNSFAGSAFDAVFDVTLLDWATGAPTAHGAPTKRHEKLVVTEQGNGFDVAYVYTPTNSGLTSAFSIGGEVWAGMQGVVDALTQPNWVWDVYDSSFDVFTWSGAVWGYPGYITSQATITNALYPSLADGPNEKLLLLRAWNLQLARHVHR